MERMISYCVGCNCIWYSDDVTEEQHCAQENEDGSFCSPDQIGRCVEGTNVKAYANFYELGSTYGGPEEGGWNKTTYDCVASVRIEAVFDPIWEDTSNAESGPRPPQVIGFETVPVGPFAKLVEQIGRVFFSKKFDCRIELSPGEYHESPRYYS